MSETAHSDSSDSPPAAAGSELPAGTTSWVETDLDAIASNVATLRARAGRGVELLAVVKSDAYGHGARHVAPEALRAGATWLGVNSLREGLAMRELVGEGIPILVMGRVPPRDSRAAIDARLSLTLYDAQAIAELGAAAESAGATASVHLKVETGTHRQGASLETLLELARAVRGHRMLALEGISTHFADIEDTTDHRFALSQLSTFRRALSELDDAGIAPVRSHAACSAAILLFPEASFDMVRAGIALYGLWPSRETLVSVRESGGSSTQLAPALSWKTRIAQVKEVETGSYVGYGRTFRTTRRSRIAVLPVGYHEGYARDLAPHAHVLIRGKRAPVVGRICMNMTLVDATDVPEVSADDVAVLIGRSGDEVVRAEDLAGWGGTIHYEIVSRIHPSVPRLAVRGGGRG